MSNVENLADFTLVPPDYRSKDPRQMAYNYANTIRNTDQGLVIYNKYVARFLYYHSLEAAERTARVFGHLLVPSDCLHWRRKKQLAHRMIPVGRKFFYTLLPSELKDREINHLLEYQMEKEEAV